MRSARNLPEGGGALVPGAVRRSRQTRSADSGSPQWGGQNNLPPLAALFDRQPQHSAFSMPKPDAISMRTLLEILHALCRRRSSARPERVAALYACEGTMEEWLVARRGRIFGRLSATLCHNWPGICGAAAYL